MLSGNGLWRRGFAAALLLAIGPALTTTVPATPASAAPNGGDFPDPPAAKRVELSRTKITRSVRPLTPYARFDPSRNAALPAAETATVAVSRAGAKAGKAIKLSGAPQRVTVTTAGAQAAAKAGVRGLLFTLRGETAGPVGVRVDPSTFRNAYGGDFASRLRLVRLPACALTTPELAQCQTQTPIATTAALTGSVPLAAGAATVLAAAATTDGPAGDYKATSLSPGGSWATSGNTGAFTYQYPIAVPAALGGTAPSVSLDYNSAGQDARTQGTNNQSSWVGDGWSTTDNFIERTYKPCVDVKDSGAAKESGDVCWAGQILTMSLNGVSTAIVYDDTTKTFRAVADDAVIKIENLTGATNGTKNGEYFKITQNGIQYFFGLNHLPGWTDNSEETKSAWAEPVYQAHDGVAACPDGSFAGTACTLGYRFNLDYSVDLRGNANAYYYAPETGYYGANAKNTAVSYTRGGTLKRIDYGMTAATIYSATAPAQIVFGTAERCVLDCTLSVSHPENYPDVPVDLNCDATGDCTNHAPSFWSRRKLTSITTKVKVDGELKPVDRYDLVQTFPDGGDHGPTLWLESIKRTGLDRLGGATADASTPAVTFNPIQLANRVGTLPGLPLMYHQRIKNVVSETGAETTVDYSTPDCSSVPSDPSTNTTGCFPVFWTPPGQPDPLKDWFYTHPVTRVTTIDNYNNYQDGSQPKLVTEYAYKGNPGWHYDDNEVVKEKNRTWGQFRGYPEVDTTTGNTSVFHYTDKAEVHDRKTLTKTYYFLGLGKGNLTSTDGTVSVADNNAYAGQVFETVTYTGDGGSINKAVVTVPTLIGPTASRARTGLSPLTAQMVRTARTLTREAVSYGWRKTETATLYNTTLGQTTTGMAVQVADRGEPGATGNVAKCTFNRYLNGKSATLVVLAEVLVTKQDCTAAGASPTGTVISDSRTSFDGNAFAYNGDGQSSPALPAYGSATLVQEASAAGVFVDRAATTYDSYGRVASVTHAPKTRPQVVYTRRVPAAGALPTATTTVTQVKVGADCSAATASSADCQVVTETVDAARQLSIAKTDEAGGLTSLTYDALGRLTAVWLPNKSKSAGAPANMSYGYQLSTTGPNVVTTTTLRDNEGGGTTPSFVTSKVLHDALLREIESQSTAENGTITVTDTQYDSHGWKVLTNDAYAAAASPSDALVSDRLSQVSIPATTVTDHDAMGRVTQVTSEHNGEATRRTRTAYTGDLTTELPPTGAVATTKVVDGRGQLTELRQYTTAPTLSGTVAGGFTASGGTAQTIAYGYTAAGQQETVTGPDKAVWSFKYDLLGRETSRTDPDAGTMLTAYDDADNVTTTRDARGVLLDFTYDLLGRKLTAVDRSKSKFQYASWTYDTLRIGKLTSSTRYVSGVTGGYTVAVDGYTSLGKSLGQTITLPSSEQPLPTSYSTSFRYSANTQLLAAQTDPAIGGLPGEEITYSRDLLGVPTKTTGIDQYVSGSTYTDFGQPSRLTVGPSSNQAEVVYAYEDETLRLKGRTISRAQGIGPVVDQTSYTYDDAGNPLTVTDAQSESGNVLSDRQCFRYDALARLADARTVSGDCATGTVSSGAGAYWQSFEYDGIGDRTKLIDHGIGAGADVTTSYTSGCSANCNHTGAQPHTLTATTGGADPTGFVYDVAGNLLTRTATSGKNQTLSWDDEGRLASVAAAGDTTTYLYDADGNQLIRRDPGRTTLFAGDTQVVVDTVAKKVLGAVRTYAHGGDGTAVAVRSTLPGGGTSYLFNDPHGTATLSMDTTTQELSRKQYKPFGETRSSAGSTGWPDSTHGYLGAAEDIATGYTDLGARKYDPTLGRFLSVDPVLETTDPNQLGGYAYAGNNPLAKSDPSGLMFPIEDREPAGKPMGGGGRGGDDGNSGGGGGGGGGGKCSGRFCVGSPNAPAGHTGADDGFKYDPTAKATWGDRLSWAKWGARRSGCAATSWFNFGPCGDNHQGMKLYSHYREGNGTPMDIDYEAGWDQDEKIRGDITSEILSAQKAAEKLAKGEGNLFSITGRSRHIADQPDTPEWQNTLGSYDQWSSADVQVTGKRMTMRIRVTAYDRYNFNPGAKAVQTGLSDDENGRFAVLGWAKGFNTSGTIERTVTWTVGSPSGGVISGGKNR